MVIVAALFALLYVALRLAQHPLGDKKDKPLPAPTEVKVMNVDFSQNPSNFPTNIPIEEGAKIVQNYNATTPTGLFSATRVFETNKSLADNYQLYKQFMESNGWEITSSVDQTNFKMLFSRKKGEELRVTMSTNSKYETKTVNITYTEVSEPSK